MFLVHSWLIEGKTYTIMKNKEANYFIELKEDVIHIKMEGVWEIGTAYRFNYELFQLIKENQFKNLHAIFDVTSWEFPRKEVTLLMYQLHLLMNKKQVNFQTVIVSNKEDAELYNLFFSYFILSKREKSLQVFPLLEDAADWITNNMAEKVSV